MRALVLGASGAVGRVATAELRRSGHDVTPASRSTTRGLAIDIRSQSGLRSLEIAMAGHDVLVNASGIESPALARFDALVEVSATAAYLDDLGHRIAPSARAVLGAGLAPGLSTLMISALTTRPGDEIDLGVLLGTGEHHGSAATAWTSALVGTQVHCPPDHGVAWNFREHRHLAGPGGERRRYLRADFPDHVLIGRDKGLVIRSYLALSSRIATRALELVAHAPRTRGLITRSPHIGSDAWHLIAIYRRTGEAISAEGVGQSLATGIVTALAAERLVEMDTPAAVWMAELATLSEALGRIDAGARQLAGRGDPNCVA